MSVLAIGIAACAASPQAEVNTSASVAASSQTAQSLKLPSLQPGSVCPVSAQQDFATQPGNKLPGYGYGPGPVFLSGQTQWFSGVYALFGQERLCITNLTWGYGFESGFRAANHDIAQSLSRQITRSAL